MSIFHSDVPEYSDPCGCIPSLGKNIVRIPYTEKRGRKLARTIIIGVGCIDFGGMSDSDGPTDGVRAES